MAWSGITEDYTVGWADVTDYFLTNNISGAWIGSWFVNEKRWADLPAHLKKIVLSSVESSHFFRNQWYFGGEASLRAKGTKLKVQSIPREEWNQVEQAAAKFWAEVAETGEVAAKVVQIFKDYDAVRQSAKGIYTCG